MPKDFSEESQQELPANSGSQVDLTTAAKLSFDLNLRRFTDADLMAQFHWPHQQQSLKFLAQLTPIFDTLYMPVEQAKYGELCASFKTKLMDHSALTLKVNVNDGTYLRGQPAYNDNAMATGTEIINTWLQKRVKFGVQFDLKI